MLDDRDEFENKRVIVPCPLHGWHLLTTILTESIDIEENNPALKTAFISLNCSIFVEPPNA
jgi:hypothetical protein